METPKENRCHESTACTQKEPQIQSRHELTKFRGLELGRIAGSFSTPQWVSATRGWCIIKSSEIIIILLGRALHYVGH